MKRLNAFVDIPRNVMGKEWYWYCFKKVWPILKEIQIKEII